MLDGIPFWRKPYLVGGEPLLMAKAAPGQSVADLQPNPVAAEEGPTWQIIEKDENQAANPTQSQPGNEEVPEMEQYINIPPGDKEHASRSSAPSPGDPLNRPNHQARPVLVATEISQTSQRPPARNNCPNESNSQTRAAIPISTSNVAPCELSVQIQAGQPSCTRIHEVIYLTRDGSRSTSNNVGAAWMHNAMPSSNQSNHLNGQIRQASLSQWNGLSQGPRRIPNMTQGQFNTNTSNQMNAQVRRSSTPSGNFIRTGHGEGIMLPRIVHIIRTSTRYTA